MTKHEFAPQVRLASLILFLVALGFPLLIIAQDPPKGGQDQKGQDGKTGQDKDGQDKPGKKQGQAKTKAEEALRKVKEEQKGKKEDPPAVKKENMEKSGAARKKIDNVRNEQRVPVPALSKSERDQITSGQASPAVQRKWARYQASLFTEPEQDKFVQKNHDDVIRLLKSRLDADYIAKLKRAMFDAANEFVNNIDEPKISAVAKVNLISLVDEIHDADQNGARVVNGVNVLIETLQKHERHGDAVLFVTMNAAINAKKLGITSVEQERRAAGALMKIARRGEIQPLLLETMCKTFGVIGVPNEGLVPEAVEVATFLANIATNENLPERTRIEAGVALGRLNKQNVVVNYAYDVEAWVLGKTYQTYLNWVVANRAAEKPFAGDSVVKYLGARLYDAVRQSLEQSTGAPGQARLQTLLSTIEPSLKDVFENKDPDREPLVEWLRQNSVQNLKLGRQAAAIKPIQKAAAPPQAAQQDAPAGR